MELLTTLSTNLIPLFGSLFDFGADVVTDPAVTETAKGAFLNLPGVLNLLVGFLINRLGFDVQNQRNILAAHIVKVF